MEGEYVVITYVEGPKYELRGAEKVFAEDAKDALTQSLKARVEKEAVDGKGKLDKEAYEEMLHDLLRNIFEVKGGWVLEEGEYITVASKLEDL